jgi:TrmH RNA methyltransferase
MPIPAASDPEIKICGAHACSAVAQRRPEDVRRVYITEAMMPSFGEFLRWCASQRLAYHVVDEGELERITQSVHHGGVAFIVRQPPPPTLGSLLHRLRGEDPSTPRLLIYLDNVQNPHNLGAIVRVAAHFGADGVLLAGEATTTSTAMTRTAEGGAEFIDVVPVALGQRPLLAARSAGFTLVATTSHGRDSLYGDGLPARTVIMLGSESHGLAPSVFGLADMTVTIPGSGQVESLNVACAAAVLLAEHWRAHHTTGVDRQSAGSDRPTSAETATTSGRGDRAGKGSEARRDRPAKDGKPRRPKPVRAGPKTGPGQPSSGRESSGKSGKLGSGEPDAGAPSSGKASPGESGKSGKSGSGKPRSDKYRSGKSGSGKSGSGKSGSDKSGSSKSGPGKSGPGKSGSGKRSASSRAGKGAVSGKAPRAGKPRPSTGRSK